MATILPRRRGGLGVAGLGFAAFVVGTSELVVVGLLNQIAGDMGMSISTTGTLVTAYALGIAIGGPIVTALTSRVDRRLMLRLSLAAFAAGNLLTAAGVSFGLLLVSRVTTGTMHGLFVGVASVVAARLAEPGREGRALSIVFGGITISTVVGVPLGTLIGQGFGWQATFLGIGLLAALVLAFTIVLMPPVTAHAGGRFIDQARAALAPRVVAMLGVGFLIIGGQFTALTYLTPFLDQITRVSGGAISALFLIYGIAIAAGTFAGGWAADRSATATLFAASLVTAAALGVLFLDGEVLALSVVAMGIWGLVGFGLVSTALQLRVISLAGPGGDFAASLGASAANAGIAIGALVGGQVVEHQGVRHAMLTAAAILLISLPATLATRSLQPPATTMPKAVAAPTTGEAD
jgi:MFS transporter, DHA1 family, inner membrane transport protein